MENDQSQLGTSLPDQPVETPQDAAPVQDQSANEAPSTESVTPEERKEQQNQELDEARQEHNERSGSSTEE